MNSTHSCSLHKQKQRCSASLWIAQIRPKQIYSYRKINKLINPPSSTKSNHKQRETPLEVANAKETGSQWGNLNPKTKRLATATLQLCVRIYSIVHTRENNGTKSECLTSNTLISYFLVRMLICLRKLIIKKIGYILI